MPEDKLPTKEEIQKNTEKRWDSLEENLKNDFYMDVYGSNTLRAHSDRFGSIAKGIGEVAQVEAMQSEEAAKILQQMYKEQYETAMKERNALDMADMPNVNISSYDVSKYSLGAVQEAIRGLPLSRLEKVVKGLSPAIKPEIPQGIKDYEEGLHEIQYEAIAEGKKPEALQKAVEKYAKNNEEASRAYSAYVGKFTEAISVAAAYKVQDAHKFDGINAGFKEISDAYNESQKEKESE